MKNLGVKGTWAYPGAASRGHLCGSSAFLFLQVHMRIQFKAKVSGTFSVNFAIGNFQPTVGKVQLPPNSFLTTTPLLSADLLVQLWIDGGPKFSRFYHTFGRGGRNSARQPLLSLMQADDLTSTPRESLLLDLRAPAHTFVRVCFPVY